MEAAVETRGLGKTYRVSAGLFRRGGVRTVEALRGVDLTIPAGEIFGLVGRNGYGKTTLIKCVASLVEPTVGAVRVFGLDSVHAGAALRRRIGWAGADERSFYYRLTGQQNLRFFAELQGLGSGDFRRRLATLAERFEITELLTRRYHAYSSGNRQRLAVIRALLHDPELLILDEPTRSLDPFAAEVLRRGLREWAQERPSRTILITSHNLDEVEALSDRVGILSRGELRACGTVPELRRELAARETIGLRVGGTPEPALLDALVAVEPSLAFEPSPGGGGWLRFEQAPGGPGLDTVLRALLGRGGAVLSVDRQELTLQDIIDHVDRGGASLA